MMSAKPSTATLYPPEGYGAPKDRRGHAMSRIATDRRPLAIDERTVVLDQAFQRFPSQIEPVECRIAAFQIRHDAQGLRVVVEASAG